MKFKAGDTLSAIAKQNGTTVSKIMAANPSIKNANSIQAGASYKLPPKINSGANKISSPNLNIRSSSNNKSTSAVTKTDNQPLGSGKTSFLKSELSKMGKDAKKAFNETKRNFGIKSSNDNNSSKKPSWFDKIIKETKRNFGPGKNTLATKGTSNITNSSTYKKKVVPTKKKDSMGEEKIKPSKNMGIDSMMPSKKKKSNSITYSSNGGKIKMAKGYSAGGRIFTGR